MKNNSQNFNKILKEETNRIKELLVEQGSSDYNCENQVGGGCNCVPNLVGCGQFPSQSDCQNNTNPNIGPGCPTPNPCCGTVAGCEGNPTLNCWFCLHQSTCLSFMDYYTYGSGAPGMNPSQAFMDTQVFIDPNGASGVYLSHQGTPIYDSEAACVQQSGCEPSNFTNSNNPISATKPNPKDDKFSGNKVDDTKERMREGLTTLLEQGSSDWNCEVDMSTGACNCVPNLVGCGQYPSQAECQANINPNTGSGCPSPEPCCSQACPAFHAFNSWPSGYPTNSPFTWTGPSIVNLAGWGAPINFPTGSMMPGTFANWFNAGQSSYCEWCADYDAGAVTVPNSSGFDIRTNYWAGAPYDSSACTCCPGTNPLGPPLPKRAQTTYYSCDTGCRAQTTKRTTDPTQNPQSFTTQAQCQEECGRYRGESDYTTCCMWCAETGGRGTPPQGCQDWMCDDCFTDSGRMLPSDDSITEEVNRIKELLVEQGSGDYNCEIDAGTGNCNCVPNLIGCGQFPSLSDCQNNTNPNMGPGCPAAESCCDDPDEIYTCYDDGTCQPDPNGPFSGPTALADCQANCSPTPDCVHGTSGGRECYYCPGISKEQQADQDIRLNEKYKPTTSPVSCKIVGNDTGRLTDGTQLYDSMLACEIGESDCVGITVDMEECHCCTGSNYGTSTAYVQNMGFFSVGNCDFCNTSACRPQSWNPGGWLSTNWWNCAPISQPLDCSGSAANPRLKPTNDEKFRGR